MIFPRMLLFLVLLCVGLPSQASFLEDPAHAAAFVAPSPIAAEQGAAPEHDSQAAPVRPGKVTHVVTGAGGTRPSAPRAATGEATSQAVRIVLGLTLLAVLPALLVCLTSFLRIITVLSMLRHAIGMQETPPNPVLIGIVLFFTLLRCRRYCKR
jgi:flagellar biosynthetic protein FliP